MGKHSIALAFLQLLSLGTAQEHQFYKWNTPRSILEAGSLDRRQTPPPGYHPEFGSCGSGTTCENACGTNWLSCQASTTLSLFCYNKVDLGQTCCENGSGRACERGYYCAWQEFGGKVWCCEDGQSLEECGVPVSSTSSTTNGPTSSGGPSSSATTTGPSTSGSSTSGSSTSGTGTRSQTLSTTTNSQCPASTVTSWATTTVVSTVAAVTVTVTTHGDGCPPPTSSRTGTSGTGTSGTGTSGTGTSGTASTSGTITKPPTSTTHRPTGNFTSTITFATGGAGGLSIQPLAFVVVLVPLLWL